MQTSIINTYEEITGIHPAAELFPLPSDEEFKALVADIKAHGLLDAVILDKEGNLIDGRSRVLALAELDRDITYEVYDGDPWVFSISRNLARRHLKSYQKAFVAAKMVETKPGGNPGSQETKLSVGDAAETCGVSETYVKDAKTVLDEGTDDDKEEVESGDVNLQDKAKEVRKRKKTQKAPAKVDGSTVLIVTDKGQTTEVPEPKKVVFNATNDNVDWAAWTWNPVTGCRHTCEFCYARAISHMDRMEAYYPFKFEPSLHEYRMTAPVNTSIPSDLARQETPAKGRVFVCSMADLFGKWVPQAWIDQVFAACRAAPEWDYLFLTKWPERYHKVKGGLLEGAWYGASVIQQKDVKRVERTMQKFPGQEVVRWISLEPMLEPIVFNDLSWCDLVVIGAQTATRQPEGEVPAVSPHFEWVADVVAQCRAAGVPYYLKPNLTAQPGMLMPKMLPKCSH